MKFVLIKGENIQSAEFNNLDKSIPISKEMLLKYSSDTCSFSKVEDLYFLWYGEHGCEPKFSEIANDIRAKVITSWNGRGVLVAVDPIKDVITVFADLYGTFPVYHSIKSRNNLIVSDSLMAFDTSKENIDYVSLLQIIKYAYTIGPYSLLNDVHRLEANTILKVDRSEVSLQRLDNFWIIDTNVKFSQAVNNTTSILIEETKKFPKSQLMFSAGWDSRTILACLLHGKSDFTCYTHGNIDSREIKISKQICDDNKIIQTINSLSSMNFDPTILTDMVIKHGSAFAPHWIKGSETAKENSRILTGGTFGAVLGGHNGPVNGYNGLKKHLCLAANILNYAYPKSTSNRENIKHVYEYYKEKAPFSNWILTEAVNKEISSNDIIKESNRRLKDVLERYYEEGSVTVESLFERYKSEHSGARYMNLQLINADSKHRNPFTHANLVRYVSTIPYKYRIHNKINREVIKKLNPKLLEYPMAATLVNASNIMLIQEASRAARKFLESNKVLFTYYSKYSKYSYKGLGWNYFEFLRKPDYLKKLSSSYITDIFDLENIVKKPIEDYDLNMYFYLDMICKSIAIDRVIGKSQTSIINNPIVKV